MVKKKELAESQLAELKAMADRGELSLDDIQDFLATLKPDKIAKGLNKAKLSRTARRTHYEAVQEVDLKDRANLEKFPGILEKGPRILAEQEARELSPQEYRDLMEVVLCVRDVQDVANGAAQGIRATIVNSAIQGSGEPYPKVEIPVEELGHKFVVNRQERGASFNPEALKETIAPNVWKKITKAKTVRVVDEEALADALINGDITMEQYQQAFGEASISHTFRVDELK